MEPFQFTCPHCTAVLRVRDKMYVGRQVNCPECQRPFQVVEAAGEMRAELVGPTATSATATNPNSVEEAARSDSAFGKSRRKLLTVGGAILMTVIVGGIAITLKPSSDSAEPPPQVLAEQNVRPPPATDPDPDDAPPGDFPQADQNTVDTQQKPTDEPAVADDDSAEIADESMDDASGGDMAQVDQPLEPEFAPEPEPDIPVAPKIDVAQALQQRLVLFDQPRSKPLAEVLVSVAEMAGSRIVFDPNELGERVKKLSEPTGLKLEKTTVGDVLAGLLRPAGLSYKIEGDLIRLIPSAAE